MRVIAMVLGALLFVGTTSAQDARDDDEDTTAATADLDAKQAQAEKIAANQAAYQERVARAQLYQQRVNAELLPVAYDPDLTARGLFDFCFRNVGFRDGTRICDAWSNGAFWTALRALQVTKQICVPPDARVFFHDVHSMYEWAKHHPELLDLPAGTVVARFVLEQFPCGGRRKKAKP